MNKTILACDDEKHMLRLLKYNLEKTDCRVLAASSGEEVLDVLKDNEVDLLIIDVMMPDLDGFETVRRMKDLDSCKDIPVIILTGRGQSNTKEEAEALGISHFLTKPFSPTHLRKTVESCLS